MFRNDAKLFFVNQVIWFGKVIFLHILCNKSIWRYFKHPLLDKTNNNINFFSHHFLVQQIWTAPAPSEHDN